MFSEFSFQASFTYLASHIQYFHLGLLTVMGKFLQTLWKCPGSRRPTWEDMGFGCFVTINISPTSLFSTFPTSFHYFFGTTLLACGLFGKNNFEDTENDEKDKDNLVDMKCHNKGQKCYRTPDGQVPFSVIVATILLPPMGVFMEFGITGWLNIVICGILTLLFYFPGLIYALILIYC